MRLERWSMVRCGGPYTPPELRSHVIEGEIHGHPDHADGTIVTTSRIVEARDGRVRTQSGSVYALGEPHPDYEALHPGARERLVGGGAA